MASESVSTASMPYVEFSDFKRTGQVIILGKTVETRELVLGICLIVAIIVIIALIPLATGVHITNILTKQCNTEQCVEVAGTIISRMNMTADPCDNFYEYSCGRWAPLHPLTPEQSARTVRGEMYERNREYLRRMLESDIKNDTEFSTERKLKDFFRSCLDEIHRNNEGGQAFLNKIVNKTGGWYVLNTYHEQQYDINDNLKKVHVDFWTDVLFKLNVGTDWNDNTKNVIEVDLGGLGLPWQTYTRTDNQAAQTKIAYREYIHQIGQLLVIDGGMDPNDENTKNRLEQFVNDVWDVELGLANMTLHTLPTNNPHADDMRLTLDQLNEQAGGTVIDWKAIIMYAFEGAGVTADTKVVLLERDFIFGLAQYLKDLEVNHYISDAKRLMNNYFTWRMVEQYSPGLSSPYFRAQQEFRKQWLGSQASTQIWEQCFNWVSTHLKEGLGALFVQNGFPQMWKDEVHEMAAKVKTETKARIDSLTWMDDATKALAKAKIEASQDKLAYPEKYDDHKYIDKVHDTLEVHRHDLLGNLVNVSKFTRNDLNRQLASTANDRDVWRVQVWAVHAEFYNPWNELLVPAGFMTFPFFWDKAPTYFNWGALGNAMSKQYIYGVDETGGYYAPNGSVADWWSRESTENFLTSRQCLIDYYNTLEAGPYRTKSSDREGEKISIRGSYYARGAVSDVGGLRNAYKAWQTAKTDDQKPLPSINLSQEQNFFVSYAQGYCFNRRDDVSYEMVRDGLVPEDVVVNAALTQFDEFAKAFNCPANSKMNLAERCDVF